MNSILAAYACLMVARHHPAVRAPTSPLPPPPALTPVSPKWGSGLVWLIGLPGKMGEEGVCGISLWKQTHPALPIPPALQDQEVEIEKGLEEGEAVEEEEVVVVVVVVVEEEWCQPSQLTAICQLSWVT